MRENRVYLDIIAQRDLISTSIIQLNGVQFLIYFELDKSSFNLNWIKNYDKDIVASRPFHWIRFGYAYCLCILKGLKMCLHNVYKKMLLHPCSCCGFVLAVFIACV